VVNSPRGHPYFLSPASLLLIPGGLPNRPFLLDLHTATPPTSSGGRNGTATRRSSASRSGISRGHPVSDAAVSSSPPLQPHLFLIYDYRDDAAPTPEHMLSAIEDGAILYHRPNSGLQSSGFLEHPRFV
jgi:hypothetical protein